MSCNLDIKLKKKVSPKSMNLELKRLGVKNSFHTEKDNQAWLDDINKNPKSPQKHLKPENRDLTMDELKNIFPYWTETCLFFTDLYFNRTSESQMKKIATFIEKQCNNIQYIKSGDLLIERCPNLTQKEIDVIKSLKKPEKEPEKLPKDKQHVPDLESGLLLCKSFSPEPFWVAFGKVDKPCFLKEKIYKEDIYNNIYRDKQGYAYMLIPLMPFGEAGLNVAEKTVNHAWKMGLREHPNFFLGYIYNLTHSKDSGEYGELVKSIVEHYTKDELIERFKLAYNQAMIYKVGGNSIWLSEKPINPEFKANKSIENHITLLNLMLDCLVSVYGKHVSLIDIGKEKQLCFFGDKGEKDVTINLIK